jgi:NitT/TauT family transport system permease protein
VGWSLLAFAAGVLVWEVLARTTDTTLPPTIAEVSSAWLDLLERGEIVKNVMRTATSVAVGLAIAIGGGIALGLLMGRYPPAEHLLRSYVDIGMSAPLAVFVPIFAVVFQGPSQIVIATVAIYCIFPVLENTRMGAAQVPAQLLEMARSFGIKRRRVITRVLLPSALPLIGTGVRIAVSKSFKGALLGEMLITVVGLGGRIRYYGSGFRVDYLFALTLTTVVLALLLVAVFQLLENALFRRFPQGQQPTTVEG